MKSILQISEKATIRELVSTANCAVKRTYIERLT